MDNQQSEININKQRKIIGKIFAGIIAVAVILLVVHLVYQSIYNRPANVYSRAMAYLDAGDYWNTVSELISITTRGGSDWKIVSDYQDAAAVYNYAFGHYRYQEYQRSRGYDGNLFDAFSHFRDAGDFRNSQEMAEIIRPEVYERAVAGYENIDSYVAELVQTAQGYGNEMHHNDVKLIQLEPFRRIFTELGDYEDSEEYLRSLNELYFELGQEQQIRNQERWAEQDRQREQEAAQAEQDRLAQSGAEMAQKNIVGTWLRGEMQASNFADTAWYTPTNLGSRVTFFDDGTVERYELNIVATGRYFFDENELVLRFPALLGTEAETRFIIFMTSADEMSLQEVPLEIATMAVMLPTPYTRR
ncbi:MAG: hypothetical protein FWG87_02960 [Defluviitaleaceae bacterium]|nr:hypothetical protein [Defluviitaleaceae bacterium]